MRLPLRHGQDARGRLLQSLRAPALVSGAAQPCATVQLREEVIVDGSFIDDQQVAKSTRGAQETAMEALKATSGVNSRYRDPAPWWAQIWAWYVVQQYEIVAEPFPGGYVSRVRQMPGGFSVVAQSIEQCERQGKRIAAAAVGLRISQGTTWSERVRRA